MDEQYYCLHLDDYSAAAFTSFGKAYYGTMAEIKAFIEALDSDPEYHETYSKLISAFREYEAGNTAVKHNVEAFVSEQAAKPARQGKTVIKRTRRNKK